MGLYDKPIKTIEDLNDPEEKARALVERWRTHHELVSDEYKNGKEACANELEHIFFGD